MNAVRYTSTNNNKRYYSKSSAKAKKPRDKISGLIKAAREEAKKVIRSMAEVKKLYVARNFNIYNLSPTSSGTNVVNHYQALTPNNDSTNGLNLEIGATNGTRIGNEIVTKKCTFKYIVTQNPYNATSNLLPQPFFVKFWIISKKQDPQGAPLADELYDSGSADFFVEGDTVDGFSGTTYDLMREVNTQAYRVHHSWVVKCGFAQSYPNGTSAAYEYFNNNDFPLVSMGEIDCTKYCYKKYVYNNDQSDEVKTPTLWVIWNCMPAVGGTLADTQLPIDVRVASSFEYYDM